MTRPHPAPAPPAGKPRPHPARSPAAMSPSFRPLALVFGTLLLAAPCHAVVVAWDDADNDDPYHTSGHTFTPGQDGGAGFVGWVLLDTTPPASHGGHYLVHPGIEGAYSWGIQGTHAMGRGLETALAAGTWTFLASHHVHTPANSGFSGFTLKSVNAPNNYPLTGGELLRFGFNRKTDARTTGITISTDAGLHYEFLDCGWTDGADDLLEYSVTWDALGNYALTVNNLTEGLTSTFLGDVLAAPEPVAMFGFANYGGTNDETLTFDTFAVTVTVIPEPAVTLPLLALAAVFLARRPGRPRPT